MCMYFIEMLSKIFNKKNLRKLKLGKYNVEVEVPSNDENCEHMFVPIDSTNKIFACYNCGLVIKGKPKNLNFFKGE